MPKTMLPEHLAKALEAGVEPIDVIQGHIKNLMIEYQYIDTETGRVTMDTLTDLYTLCYDVIFYKSDLEAM